jgi:hypothetical protein
MSITSSWIKFQNASPHPKKKSQFLLKMHTPCVTEKIEMSTSGHLNDTSVS